MKNLKAFEIFIVLTLSLCFASVVFADNSALNKKLYEAVLFQDSIKLKDILSKGANVNYKENGRPVLGWAAQSGNLEIVELLLAAKPDVNIADDGIGHTPLMRAIDTQQIPIVKVLLKAKSNPNAKNAEGETCLDMAVESRKPEIVSAVIEAGADVKYVSAEGESPALKAAQDGMAESLEIIKILGKAGANMNASNAAYTPLSYAVEQGNKDLVKALLDAGADANAKTAGGSAPIISALDKDRIEILKLLINAKANPNFESSYGSTPLISAIENDNKEAVELLLKAGADASKSNSSGTTPAEYAAQYGHTEIADLIKTYLPKDSNNNEVSSDPSAFFYKGKEIPIDPNNNGKECDIVKAARMQMELHGKLQERVDAGKMSSDIFRTFGEDTKGVGEMYTTDPSQACRLFEGLAVKYGVKLN